MFQCLIFWLGTPNNLAGSVGDSINFQQRQTLWYQILVGNRRALTLKWSEKEQASHIWLRPYHSTPLFTMKVSKPMCTVYTQNKKPFIAQRTQNKSQIENCWCIGAGIMDLTLNNADDVGMHSVPLLFSSHTTQFWSSSQSRKGPFLLYWAPHWQGDTPHPLSMQDWDGLRRMRLRAAGSLHFAARWLNSSFPAVKPSTLANHHSSTFSSASEKAGRFF